MFGLKNDRNYKVLIQEDLDIQTFLKTVYLFCISAFLVRSHMCFNISNNNIILYFKYMFNVPIFIANL